jgi:hypothetical protein
MIRCSPDLVRRADDGERIIARQPTSRENTKTTTRFVFEQTTATLSNLAIYIVPERMVPRGDELDHR